MAGIGKYKKGGKFQLRSGNSPLTFKNMKGIDELSCREMADLHQRIYHYLKPFKKDGKTNE